VARLFSPVRLVIAGVVLLAVAGVLYVAPSNQYLFLPDRARAVAPYVKVKGERDDHDGGGIYYVAVEVKKASILEKLFHGLHEGSTLVPESAVRSQGESDTQHRRVELRAMAESQEIAAAVALKELGYSVDVRSSGTVIAAVAPDGPSAGKLKASDIVVRVDGRRTLSPAALRRLIGQHEPGQTVHLVVRRGDSVRKVPIKTAGDPHDPARPIIGVFTDCTIQRTPKISLPLPVHIDLGQVGGPSAGLAFALDVVEELGHDVDRGHKVAASGELCVDGTVVPVGGLKQKTIGARRAGCDVFLVPAGENATEARRYAGSMRVLPVESFRQALLVLATLPRKHPKT
jgi:PDZ domain-containing protein